MPKHNGITLGPASPLLTPEGARRKLARTEQDDQMALLELLVGKARKGEARDPAGGMILKYPDLYLLYAIPNGGRGSSKAWVGRQKAMGLLRDMPDLHLPVMRGPFIGLYVELKRAGQKARPSQAVLHECLRAAGHCVVTAVGVEQGAAVILGYLALPKNRVSARPVPLDIRIHTGVPVGLAEHGAIDAWLATWRTLCYTMLLNSGGTR